MAALTSHFQITEGSGHNPNLLQKRVSILLFGEDSLHLGQGQAALHKGKPGVLDDIFKCGGVAVA